MPELLTATLVEDRYNTYASHGNVAWRKDREELWIFEPAFCKKAFASRTLTSQRTSLADAADRAGKRSLGRFFRRWLMYRDGPRHMQVRNDVVRTLRSINTKDLRLPTLAKPDLPFELVRDYCEPFVWHVLPLFFGLPIRDISEWQAHIGQLVALPGIVDPVPEQFETAERSLLELRKRVMDSPFVGLSGSLFHTHTDREEAVDVLINVIGDGIHPTIAALATEIWLRYSEKNHAGSQSGPFLFHLEPPFQYAARTALQEMNIAGEQVAPGQRVVLCIGAANRRSLAQGLKDGLFTFGLGRHACVGRHLAESCIEAGVEHFFATYGHQPLWFAVPTWTPSVGYRSISALMIR